MNSYTFEELYVGQKESFVFELNDKKMELFCNITGDINPLHNSTEFAIEKGYSEKVVYGMLTSSCLSTLAGVYLPGERSLIQQVQIKFIRPVFVSSSPLTVNGEIISKDERFRNIEIKYDVFNNKKEKVLRGNMTIGIL